MFSNRHSRSAGFLKVSAISCTAIVIGNRKHRIGLINGKRICLSVFSAVSCQIRTAKSKGIITIGRERYLAGACSAVGNPHITAAAPAADVCLCSICIGNIESYIVCIKVSVRDRNSRSSGIFVIFAVGGIIQIPCNRNRWIRYVNFQFCNITVSLVAGEILCKSLYLYIIAVILTCRNCNHLTKGFVALYPVSAVVQKLNCFTGIYIACSADGIPDFFQTRISISHCWVFYVNLKGHVFMKDTILRLAQIRNGNDRTRFSAVRNHTIGTKELVVACIVRYLSVHNKLLIRIYGKSCIIRSVFRCRRPAIVSFQFVSGHLVLYPCVLYRSNRGRMVCTSYLCIYRRRTEETKSNFLQ